MLYPGAYHVLPIGLCWAESLGYSPSCHSIPGAIINQWTIAECEYRLLYRRELGLDTHPINLPTPVLSSAVGITSLLMKGILIKLSKKGKVESDSNTGSNFI